jgi:hypothetical protein
VRGEVSRLKCEFGPRPSRRDYVSKFPISVIRQINHSLFKRHQLFAMAEREQSDIEQTSLSI